MATTRYTSTSATGSAIAPTSKWTKTLCALCTFLWAAVLSPSTSPAQASLDSIFRTPTLVLDTIPGGITDIDVDQEGNVYLLRSSKHQLVKFFRATGFDSVLTIGGKGIGDEGFNFPTKICVPNRQSVFLLDYMNRRIVQLNTNLKVIEDVNFLTLDIGLEEPDVETLWPISFVVGPTGEFFLLNQEDLRIYKLTDNGKLERAFAGLDYGAGSVREPWDLAINKVNLVFAIDSAYQQVHIYDLFGTFQYRLAPNLPFRWHHAATTEEGILLVGKHHLFYYDLLSKAGGTVSLEGRGPCIDAAASHDYIYLLFENQVHLYRLTGQH